MTNVQDIIDKGEKVKVFHKFTVMDVLEDFGNLFTKEEIEYIALCSPDNIIPLMKELLELREKVVPGEYEPDEAIKKYWAWLNERRRC